MSDYVLFITFLDLAGEMCQISQMLRDQKNLIQSLVDFSVLGKKPSTMVETPTDVESKPIHHLKGSDEAKKKLLTVLEKVEGAAVIFFFNFCCRVMYLIPE